MGELAGEGEGEGRGETTTGGRTGPAGAATAAAGAGTGTTGPPGTGPGTAAPAAAGGAGAPAAPAGALTGTKDAILAPKTTKKGLSEVGGLRGRVRIQNSTEKEPSFIRLEGLFDGQARRAGLFEVFQAVTTLFGTALHLLFWPIDG